MAGIGLVGEAAGIVRVGMLDVDMVGRVMNISVGGLRHAITHVGTARIVVRVLVLAVTRRLPPASGGAIMSEVPSAANVARRGWLLALDGLAFDLATAAFADGCRRPRAGKQVV